MSAIMKNTNKRYNWGILGPGFIANKVMPDFARANGANVLGVASRTPGKAKAFADKWKIERVYTDYESLVSDQDIDVVYITTPGGFHKDCAVLAMEHGKHVLCEKPFALNGEEAKEMAMVARKNHVFLMEAMWTRFFPAMIKVREMIDSERIGEVRQIVSDFSYDVPFDEKYHLFDTTAGGGTLVDGGIYPLSLSGFLYRTLPDKAMGIANIWNGVDVRDTVLLQFPNGRQASFICGADVVSPWDAIVYGTKGHIRIPSFYACIGFELVRYGDDVFDKTAYTIEKYEFPIEGLGYQFEINEVMDCLDEGLLESRSMPLDETIGLMEAMDGLRKQWGVLYPGEQV